MDYNRLNGPQRKLLRVALGHLIRDLASWDRVLDEGGFRRLSDYGTGSLDNLLYEFIATETGAGQMARIMAYLQQVYPASPHIQDLPIELGFLDEDAEQQRVVASKGGLERLVRGEGDNDLMVWASALMEMGHRICRIRSRKDASLAMGTGVLVGPDLVLTNYHVIEHLIGQPGNATDLTFTFGAAETTAGPSETATYRPADAWHIVSSPYSQADLGEDRGLPSAGELDFALLRLEAAADTDATPSGVRGFLDLSKARTPPPADRIVFILQHPRGENLRHSVGETLGAVTPLRLRYDADTDAGSSGGLVLDQSLVPVALHHAGDPASKIKARYNQGIPLALIREAITKAGVTLSAPIAQVRTVAAKRGTIAETADIKTPATPKPIFIRFKKWLMPALGAVAVSVIAGLVLKYVPCMLDDECREGDLFAITVMSDQTPLPAHEVQTWPSDNDKLVQTKMTDSIGQAIFRVQGSIHLGRVSLGGDQKKVCPLSAMKRSVLATQHSHIIDTKQLFGCVDQVGNAALELTEGLRTVTQDRFWQDRLLPQSGLDPVWSDMRPTGGLWSDRIDLIVRNPTLDHRAGWHTGPAIGTTPIRPNGNASMEIPGLPVTPPSADRAPLGIPAAGIVLDRAVYSVGFDPAQRLPLWVAFTIDQSRNRGFGLAPRDEWFPDPDIPVLLQTGNDAYQSGPYARGPLLRRTDGQFSRNADLITRIEREASYYTVTAPQPPATTMGAWRLVEEFGAKLSVTVGPVYTVSGPIFPPRSADDSPVLVIGPELTPVPTELFRVYLWREDDRWQAIAFVVPNDGTVGHTAQSLVAPVQSVEELTGLTFFPDLGTEEAADLKSDAAVKAFAPRWPQFQ